MQGPTIRRFLTSTDRLLPAFSQLLRKRGPTAFVSFLNPKEIGPTGFLARFSYFKKTQTDRPSSKSFLAAEVSLQAYM